MSIFEAALLGLVQGLTEFIPISSSGHLVIGQYLFNGGSDHLFLEFINIGTVIALLIYFRKRIINIIHDVLVNKNYRLARNIIITALPAGLVGFLFADYIAGTAFFNNIYVVVITLALVGVLMIVLEKLPKKNLVESGEKLNIPRALIIGIAQVAALVPGVSRSGSTIIAGRFMGLKPAQAAEYSFLVSVPIMLGVTAKVFLKASDRAYFFANWEMLVVGNIMALLSGLFAIGFLMKYLAKHDLSIFGWYRVGLATLVLVVLLLQ